MGVSAAEKKIKENIDYSKMDRESRNLCKAINEIPGLCTLDSCCGHGKDDYEILFTVTSLNNLSVLLSGIHGKDHWAVSVYVAWFEGWPRFVLIGPPGDFKGADNIAREIRGLWRLAQKEREKRRRPRKAK